MTNETILLPTEKRGRGKPPKFGNDVRTVRVSFLIPEWMADEYQHLALSHFSGNRSDAIVEALGQFLKPVNYERWLKTTPAAERG